MQENLCLWKSPKFPKELEMKIAQIAWLKPERKLKNFLIMLIAHNQVPSPLNNYSTLSPTLNQMKNQLK